MKTDTSKRLLQYLKSKQQSTAKELGKYLGISRQALFKHHLTPLLKENKISKTGRPPKVFYSLADSKNFLENFAFSWVKSSKKIYTKYYCETRDVFQSRLNKMTITALKEKNISEDVAYLLGAIVGEIGNNSFDHNLGQWPDIPGIFFAYDFKEKNIALADRGQGVLATLKKVKPELKNDQQALEVAFKEKISARAPEQRGNGLKFVKNIIASQKMHLTFYSGQAKADLDKKMVIKKTASKINGCLAIIKF